MEKEIDAKKEDSRDLETSKPQQTKQTRIELFKERFEAASRKLQERIAKFLGVIGLFMLLPYVLLKLVELHLHSSLVFSLAVALCFAILIWLLWWVLSKRFYSVADTKLPTDIYVPLAIIICTSWHTMTCFGALSSALYDSDLIQVTPAPPKHNFAQFTDFFLWYGLDLIPELDINKTFNWDVPFQYTDNKVAWLLLIFKIIIVWLIIKQIYSWNKWRKKRNVA